MINVSVACASPYFPVVSKDTAKRLSPDNVIYLRIKLNQILFIASFRNHFCYHFLTYIFYKDNFIVNTCSFNTVQTLLYRLGRIRAQNSFWSEMIGGLQLFITLVSRLFTPVNSVLMLSMEVSRQINRLAVSKIWNVFSIDLCRLFACINGTCSVPLL